MGGRSLKVKKIQNKELNLQGRLDTPKIISRKLFNSYTNQAKYSVQYLVKEDYCNSNFNN